MMAAVKLRISFGKSVGSYAPGDEVTGSLNVQVTHQVRPTIVSAIMEGKASVKNESRHGGEFRISYKSETYVDVEQCLYNIDELDLPHLFMGAEGQTFDFNFRLPRKIPSSFEFEGGFVRYSVTCKLEGYNFSTWTTKKYFTVNTVVDLNNIPRSQLPAFKAVNQDGNRWWLCTRRGILEAAIQIPRRGYVPGEVITINAEINNRGSRPIGCVSARLVQIVKYYYTNWPRKFKRTVAQVTRGYIMGYCTQHWFEESMLIPPVVASYLEYCKLIAIKYKIYFRISRDGDEELTLKLPIIIGNVPLNGILDAVPVDSALYDSSSVRAHQVFEPCPFGPYAMMEKTGVGADTHATNEDTFSPHYVTYSC